MINSKSYFLIVKNWTKSILRLRFIFVIFLFLIFIFASVASAFLEVEKQIKTEFQNNKFYQNEDENTSILEGDYELGNDHFSNYFNLFCTDYFQFSFVKLETVDPKNKDSAKIRKRYLQRMPKWTFGGKNSCFKLNNLNLEQLTFNLLPTTAESNRMVISSFSLAKILNQNQKVIEMNYISPYYLNSLHGKIMQKYWNTENEKYLKMAKKLEEKFFYPVVKNMIEKEMNHYLVNLSKVYHIRSSSVVKKVSAEEIQDQLKTIENLLTPNSNEFEDSDFRKFFYLEKKLAKIENFLKKDNREILENRYQVSKEILEKLLDDLKTWEKNSFIKKFTPINLQKLADERKDKKKKLFLLEMIAKKEINKIYFWLKNIFKRVSESKLKISSSQDIWLLSNITEIDERIRQKIDSLKIIIWKKTEKILKTLKEKEKDIKINFSTENIEKIQKTLTQKNVSKKELLILKNQIDSFDLYLQKTWDIKCFFLRKNELKSLYKEVKSFLSLYYGEHLINGVEKNLKKQNGNNYFFKDIDEISNVLKTDISELKTEEDNQNFWNRIQKFLDYLGLFKELAIQKLEKIVDIIQDWNLQIFPFFQADWEKNIFNKNIFIWKSKTVNPTEEMEKTQIENWEKFQNYIKSWKKITLTNIHQNSTNITHFKNFFEINIHIIKNFIDVYWRGKWFNDDFLKTKNTEEDKAEKEHTIDEKKKSRAKNQWLEDEFNVEDAELVKLLKNKIKKNFGFADFFQIWNLDYHLETQKKYSYPGKIKNSLSFQDARKIFHFILKLRQIIYHFNYDQNQPEIAAFLNNWKVAHSDFLKLFFYYSDSSVKSNSAKIRISTWKKAKIKEIITVILAILKEKITKYTPLMDADLITVVKTKKTEIEEYISTLRYQNFAELKTIFMNIMKKWFEINQAIAQAKNQLFLFQKYTTFLNKNSEEKIKEKLLKNPDTKVIQDVLRNGIVRRYSKYYSKYYKLLLSEKIVDMSQKFQVAKKLLSSFKNKLQDLKQQGFDEKYVDIEYLVQTIPSFLEKLWKKNSVTYQDQRKYKLDFFTIYKNRIFEFASFYNLYKDKRSWKYIFENNKNWFNYLLAIQYAAYYAFWKNETQRNAAEKETDIEYDLHFQSYDTNLYKVDDDSFFKIVEKKLSTDKYREMLSLKKMVDFQEINFKDIFYFFSKKISEIVAEFYDFKFKVLKSHYILEQKQNIHNIFIELNPDFHFNLMEGRLPVLSNEIIISPIFARKNSIKIGDTIEALDIKNLKVVGIGTQKEFIYPLILITEEVAQKNHKMIYFNAKNNNLVKKISDVVNFSEKQFFYKFNKDFFIVDKGEKKTKNKRLKNTKIYLFGEENYTKTSLIVNKEKLESGKNIFDSINFANFKPSTLEEYQRVRPYKFMYNFPVLIYKIVSYSAIFIVVLFSFLIGFINYYMIEKKMKKNKQPIGVLRGLGYKNSTIIFGALPLSLIVILILIVGWFAGIFLQIPIFFILEDYFNFQFLWYNFNFINLGIILAVITFTIVFSFSFFWYFKFVRVNILDLIYVVEKKANIFVRKIRNFVFLNGYFNKYLIVKFNQLFFSLIWKKIFALILIFVLSSMAILIIIITGTVENTTIKMNFQETKYNWEIDYLSPVQGNIWTKKKYYANYGYEEIFNVQKDSIYPLKNLGINAYVRPADEKAAIPEIIDDYDNFNEILWLTLPLHNKVMNFNSVVKILKIDGNDDTEEIFCKIIRDNFANIFSFKTKNPKCLTGTLNRFSPIDYKNPDQAIKHLPISGNVVQYIPDKDEFYTKIKKATVIQTQKKITLMGVHEKTKNFNFLDSIKKELFSEKNEKNYTIPVVVNTRFLKENGLKVGDSFQIRYKKKILEYAPTKKEIRFEDWTYIDDEGVERKLNEIDDETSFFYGRELELNPNWKIKKNGKKTEYFYKNKKIKLLFKKTDANGKSQYLPWIDINKVKLNINDFRKETVSPFLPLKGEKLKFGTTQINWWTRKILDKEIVNKEVETVAFKDGIILSFKIIDKIQQYEEARAYTSQKIVNKLLGLPTNKSKYGQYQWFNGRMSKEEVPGNVFFNFAVGSEYGFMDGEIINKVGKDFVIQKLNYISIQKKIISNLIKYLFKLNFVILFCIFMIIIGILFFTINGTLEVMQKTSIKMKIFGFNNKMIILQNIQVLFVPFLLSFVGVIFFLKWLFAKVVFLVNDYIPIDIFYDFNPWLIGFGGLLIFIILVITIWKNYKKINNVYLPETIIRE